MAVRSTLPDLRLVHGCEPRLPQQAAHRTAHLCALSGCFQFGLQLQVGDGLNKLGQDFRDSVHLQLHGSEVRLVVPPVSSPEPRVGYTLISS